MIKTNSTHRLIPYLLMFLSFLGFGQSSLDNNLISDKNFRQGKLKNGLTYYIKSLPNSQPKVDLRLLVKAGIFNQDSSQVDIAHFVEHMAFKTTRNFPKGIRNHIELWNKYNMSRFDFNGHSGLRFTQYKYRTPANNTKALKTGLLWFKDIADGLKMTVEDIDKDRGVMLQEFIERSRDNLEEILIENKLERQLFPGRQNLSNISDHLRNFNPQVLRSFYKEWYRPNLMGISIVGPIKNLDQIEKEIIKRFSNIEVNQNPKKLINYDSIFINRPTRFVVVNGKAANNSSIERNTIFKLHFRDKSMLNLSNNIEVIQRKYKWNIFQHILNKRFREASDVYNSSFSAHAFQRGILPLTLRIKVTIREDKEDEALKKTFRILKQIQKKGISDAEFKEAMEKQFNSIVNNVDHQDYWIETIKNYFFWKDPVEFDNIKIISDWLSNFTLGDFNQFIREENFSMPEDIGIIASSNHQALYYKENKIRNWIKEIGEEKVTAYSSPTIPKYLMSPAKLNQLKGGKIKDKEIGASGALELKLNNGIKLILKSYKPSSGVDQDKILIHGFTSHGALDFSQIDYFSAINSPRFIKNSGAGGLDKFQMQRYLSSTSLWWGGIHFYMDNLESGIKIGASPEDLEKMLQLIYLYFTHPNKNEEAFKDWKNDRRRFYANPSSDLKDIDLRVLIRKFIGDSSGTVLGTDHFNGLKKTNMEWGHKIFCKIFQASNEFTFLISGDFKTESVLPILNKYLGNLPNHPSKSLSETSKVIYNSLPKGPLYKKYSLPENYKKSNMLYKPVYIKETDAKPDWKERLKIKALGAVVDKLVWDLRFEKGYSLYAVGAAGRLNEETNQYTIGASFNCLPEEYPSLREEFLLITNDLKSTFITEELLEQSLKRMIFLAIPDGRINSNREMQNRLYSYYRYNTVWVDPQKKLNFIKTLTPVDIKESANELFKDEHLYEFAMGGNL